MKLFTVIIVICPVADSVNMRLSSWGCDKNIEVSWTWTLTSSMMLKEQLGIRKQGIIDDHEYGAQCIMKQPNQVQCFNMKLLYWVNNLHSIQHGEAWMFPPIRRYR